MEKSESDGTLEAVLAFVCCDYQLYFTFIAAHLHITHTHTHPFNVPLSRTTQVSQYQKGKTNLDFTGVRDSEWQWHQLGYMQVCTSLQTDNHSSTPPLSCLQVGCPSCHPTNNKPTSILVDVYSCEPGLASLSWYFLYLF